MDRAKEIADKIDISHFNRKLVDATEHFIKTLGASKKNLSKGDLISLVKYVVKYPDVDGVAVSNNIVELARTACEAKDAFVATTVQVLIEEGQRQSTPKFKPEGGE